jgi:hypothetical protein
VAHPCNLNRGERQKQEFKANPGKVRPCTKTKKSGGIAQVVENTCLTKPGAMLSTEKTKCGYKIKRQFLRVVQHSLLCFIVCYICAIDVICILYLSHLNGTPQ